MSKQPHTIQLKEGDTLTYTIDTFVGNGETVHQQVYLKVLSNADGTVTFEITNGFVKEDKNK